MPSKISNRCMFIGLPSSGKSSFIGALWHVFETDEIDVTYSMTAQPEDREYLNILRGDFLACNAPERTKTDFARRIELSIKDNSTGDIIDFVFPDLSGETYLNQYIYRKISEDYLAQINDCNSIMLFINPDRVKKSYLISSLNGMFDDEANTNAVEDGENRPDSENLESNMQSQIDWKAEMSQTQTMLVDILQMIKNKLVKPCRICIIVSAWDLVNKLDTRIKPHVTPEQWLLHELPLLKQFLDANDSTFLHTVIGISAQGGSYKIDENTPDVAGIANLQEIVNQSERIIVQQGESINNDITAPIKWLLNGKR